MASRSHSMRLGRVLGIAALALAVSAPVAMAKEITSGAGGGGGTTTPAPTAAPCATVESFTIKGVKGPGATAAVDTGFNLVSCSTNPETLVYDMVLTGSFTHETYWTLSDWSVGELAAGKNVSQKWTMIVPFYTATRLDITVRDAATGAVLATKVGFASAVSGKP